MPDPSQFQFLFSQTSNSKQNMFDIVVRKLPMTQAPHEFIVGCAASGASFRTNQSVFERSQKHSQRQDRVWATMPEQLLTN